MTDTRRLNEVWAFKNPKNELYIMGRVGSGRNSFIITLDYCKTKNEQNLCLERRRSELGQMWKNLKY